MKTIARYVVSVCDNRKNKFYQRIKKYNIRDVISLDCKKTKNHGIGAGMSHQDCVHHSTKNGYRATLVFEDDVELLTGYEDVFNFVFKFIECNNDWEYITFSHTFIGAEHGIFSPHPPDLKYAESILSDKIFRINESMIGLRNMHALSHNVIGNSCCVLYNNSSDRFLTQFDPRVDPWMDVWSPKNLNTILVVPVVATQCNKQWQHKHQLLWSDYLISNGSI